MSEIISYSILLAAGLSSDILYLAIGSGVAMQPYSTKLNFKAALIFSFVQIIMALFAINVGFIISSFIPDFSYQMGTILIAFVGLKYMLETNKIKDESRTFLIEDSRILWRLSLASSFNTLLAFIGFGLTIIHYTLFPISMLIGFVFFTTLIGIIIGNKYNTQHLGRFGKLIGGIILIFLAVYMFFQ
ncbi:MAG: manganese efflux pump [Bacteroidales bacterium]|jgi:putative Mn2+ efflux pump MntP|nr:manganese efflux pump [Bacteroidales bacterium]